MRPPGHHAERATAMGFCFFNHAAPERRALDRRRDAWLTEQGWRVLRIPNDIVIGGGDIVIDRIKAALAPHIPSSDPR